MNLYHVTKFYSYLTFYKIRVFWDSFYLIYNCPKHISEVSLYSSLKYYWKTNENSTENQSLVTRLLTSQFFSCTTSIYKVICPVAPTCGCHCCLWFLLQFNLPRKLITTYLRLNSSSGVVAASTFGDYIKQQKGPHYKEENWLKRHYALKKGNICIRWSTPGFIVSVLKQTISHYGVT